MARFLLLGQSQESDARYSPLVQTQSLGRLLAFVTTLLVALSCLMAIAVGRSPSALRHATPVRSKAVGSGDGAINTYEAGEDELSPLLEAARLAPLTKDTGALTRAENTLQNAIDLEKLRAERAKLGAGDQDTAAEEEREPSKYDCLMPKATWSASKEVLCCLHHHMGCPFDDASSDTATEPPIDQATLPPMDFLPFKTTTVRPSPPALPVQTSSLQPPPVAPRGSSSAEVSTSTPGAHAQPASVTQPASERPLGQAGAGKDVPWVLVGGVAFAIALALVLGLCLWQRRAKSGEGDEDSDCDNEADEDSVVHPGGPNTAQALRDASAPQALNDAAAPGGGLAAVLTPSTAQQRELRRLAEDIARLEPTLALPAPGGAAAPPASAALREEAAREVERILAARDMRALLGEGAQQRRAEFRRLVLLLHPDKHLVSGERASLAMRRLVESYRTLHASEARQ